MTGYVYRASWPILDEDATISTLVAEASGQIDAMARASGARIAGPVTWRVAGLRLLATAPAVPVAAPDGRTPHGAVASQVGQIAVLAARGMSDGEIATVLGPPATRDSVRKVRQRAGIQAGGLRRLGSGKTEGVA